MFTGLPDEANDVSGQFATALAVMELHSYLGAVNSPQNLFTYDELPFIKASYAKN